MFVLYSNTGCNSGNSYGYFIQIMVMYGFKLGSVFADFYYTIIYYIISYIMLLLIKVVKNKNNYL